MLYPRVMERHGESIVVVGVGNDCDVLLMPSTHSAYPQVISRRFASANLMFSQLKTLSGAGSIPGSSTENGWLTS